MEMIPDTRQAAATVTIPTKRAIFFSTGRKGYFAIPLSLVRGVEIVVPVPRR